MIPASGSPSPRKVRVLLVDDSAVMRSLLRMVLEPQPSIEIAGAASSGEAGLAAFESLHPDLVLLDIEMPGMNGLEVLSTIRRSNRRVPVIMCSTLTSRGARITIEALTRGATDYVAKPGAQNGIREAVETLTRELLPKILALFPQKPRPSASIPATRVPWTAAPGSSRRARTRPIAMARKLSKSRSKFASSRAGRRRTASRRSPSRTPRWAISPPPSSGR